MDNKTKNNIFKFFEENIDQVGDLARWFRSPQRRFHRHEFFGIDIADIHVNDVKISVRDLGYGGCGAIMPEDEPLLQNRPGEFDTVLSLFDQKAKVRLVERHAQSLHLGYEFVGLTESQHSFLKEFIQYMDAGLLVRIADLSSVFPAFRGEDWLNVTALREAIRFSIRVVPQTKDIEAYLFYVSDGKHIYFSWANGGFEIGTLDGQTVKPAENKAWLRQIASILIGIRQGTSLPNFAPVIEAVTKILR